MGDLSGWGTSWGGSDSQDTSQTPTPRRSRSEDDDSPSKKSGRDWKGGVAAAGKSLSQSGATMMANAGEGQRPVAYKRGGKVRRTGKAVLHRGERVIPKSKRKKVERLMKREGVRMKARR